MRFRSSILHGNRWGSLLPTFLFIYTIYLICLSPTIFWRDAPEFIITGWTLGISHPPGMPFYNMVGKGFSCIPIGDIAFRFNFLSLLFGFLTLLLLWFLTVKILSLQEIANKELIATLSVLFFAFSSSFWVNTAETEVYTMNSFFLLCILYIAVVWMEKKDSRYLFIGSLIYGLSTGVHGGVVFFLPGLLVYLILNRRLLRLRDLFLVSFFFILGFSIYLYLPLRSLSNPTFDWGNPETYTAFLRHITDRKDQAVYQSIISFDIWKRSIFYIKMLIDELTPWGVVLMIVGIFFSIRKNFNIFALLFCIAAGNSLFFFRYWNDGVAFIPSILVMIIWIASGIYGIINFTERYRKKEIFSKGFVFLISFLFILFSFFKNFSTVNRSSYYAAYMTARENYTSQKKDAVVITLALWFPFRYLQDIERMRDDINIVLISDIKFPDYFNPITKERYPELCIPEKREDWEMFISSFISCNIGKFPLYWEPSEYNKKLYRNLRPESFLFRIVPESSETIGDDELNRYLGWLEGFLNREFQRIDIFNEREAQVYYTFLLGGIADYFLLINKHGHAINLYKISKAIKPDDATTDNIIAYCYERLGNISKAREIYKDVLKRDHNNIPAKIGLGFIYLREGNRSKAEEYFKEVLKNKKDPWALYGMARIYIMENNVLSALSYFTEALSVSKDKELNSIMKKEMEKLERATFYGSTN